MKNNVSKFIIPAGLMVSLAFTVFAMAPSKAGAQQQATQQQIQQLNQQLATLKAMLAGLTGIPSASGVPTGFIFNRTLNVGSAGEDVRNLQRVLNADPQTRVAQSGVGSPGNESSTFGLLTRDAVMRFQNKYRAEVLTPLGLTNPTGVVGPATRAKLNSLTSQPAPTTAPPASAPVQPAPTAPEPSPDPQPTPVPAPTLSGGEGEIGVDNQSLSSYEARLGAVDTVYEIEVEAVDSDVAINRIDFMFNARPWLYFNEVILRVDGSVVSSLENSPSNYPSIGNNYRARFSNLNTIIKEGDSIEITLEVKTRSSLAGNRINDKVSVWVPERGIRFIDGSSTVGLGPEGAALSSSTVTFEDLFGTATLNSALSVSSPEASVFILNENTRKTIDNVLSFRLDAKQQNVTVKGLDFRINTGSGNANQAIHRVRLYMGNTLIGSQSVSSGSGERTVTFSNINRTINRDASATFRVEVEVNGGNQFTTPNTLEVKLHEVRAESADFVDIVKTNLQIGQGTVHDLVLEGLVIQPVSKTAITQSNGTVGKYTFIFDLKATGRTFFFDEDGAKSIVANVTAGSSQLTGVSIGSNATLTANGNYRINKDQSKRFTVEVFSTNASASGINHVTLQELVYGTSDIVGTPTGEVLKLRQSDFRSPAIFLLAN